MKGHRPILDGASALHSLPGPDDITRQELENGPVVLSRSNFNSPLIVVSGYLETGGLLDPPEKLGLADFTAAALMRGTEHYESQELYDRLESNGARLSVSGGTHITRFGGKCLAEDFGMLLELLVEVLCRPTFPPEQVERLRAQLLTSLAIRAQDTAERAAMAFDEIVYAGHPYSLPTDGFPETINAIQAADLAEFHQRHFGPQGMVVAVVGAIDPQDAVERVDQAFRGWTNPQQTPLPALPPITSLTEVTVRRVEIPGKSQADLLIGAAAMQRRSPDFPAAALGNDILGQFGLMGRIGEAVREKAGLAYYALSSLGAGAGPGPWYISAGVDPENVDRAVELIIAEIRRFVDEPVSQEELEDSQAHFIGRLPLSLESNGGVAAGLTNLERFDLGLDYYWHYTDMIHGVTLTQIQEVARRYLDPGRLGVAIAGP